MVEADPDVAAAMDILGFALYHENNGIATADDSVDAAAGQKRPREEEPKLVEGSESDENDARRRRVDGEEGGESAPTAAGNTLADVKAAVYGEVSRTIEDSVSIDDLCVEVDDRALVLQAVQSLEEDGKVMQSDGEVYLID